MISFIIPAFNEAFELPRALAAIRRSAEALQLPFEILVVNDGSTDATPDIARQAGARVIDVNLHKIAAVRNAGARQAQGDRLFFVDADTQINEAVLRAAVSALDRGAVGGGAWVGFSEQMGWPVRMGIFMFSIGYMKVLCWAAGCFIYARREVFQAVGGFDEQLFACEEIVLSRALKTQGRFVVLGEAVQTSGRKMRMYSAWRIVPMIARLLLYGPKIFRDRRGMEWWYEGKRESDRRP